ncbi:hypothetical protein AB3X96_41600 [Paraburkholderia sp. BR13439]|uniref:hypothetical protein n=1 Tax=Paraburkholderia sp. BR13439 TaxID=3236996 RepID=UPI0034CEA4CE
MPDELWIALSYETGQDAFWIRHALQGRGIECCLVDPASISVEHQKWRDKTHRMEVIVLAINLRVLAAW